MFDRHFKFQQSKLMLLARVIDISIISAGMWLAIYLYGVRWSNTQIYQIVLIPLPIFIFVANAKRIYNSWRSASLKDEAVNIFITWVVTYVISVGLIIFLKIFFVIPRLILFGWLVIPLVMLIFWHLIFRMALRSFRGFGWNFKKVAIIGAGELGKHLAEKMLNAPWMGFELIGFYDDNLKPGTKPMDGFDIEVKGTPDDLIAQTKNNSVDQAYIALPLKSEDRIQEIITHFAGTYTAVYWVPNYFTFDLLHSRWADFDGLTTISIFETPFYGIDSWLKQLEDMILGILFTLITILPMLIIAIIIKATSRGPILYKQKRYGYNGKEFVVWKFRSMANCEKSGQFVQAKKNDPRVTKFGAFLRKTSLDELPQFVNVLQGRMSIVGPRPHPILLDEQFNKKIYGYMLRHKVKPGITGWAQVNGFRGETDTMEKMENRIKYDIQYIKKWSLGLDLKIIMLTILKSFTGENAY